MVASWLGNLVRVIRRSRRGSLAIQIGLVSVAVIGMVALGTEITYLLLKHRQMQSAADSAALGGATALAAGYPANYQIEAWAIASAAGYVNGTGGTTVTVNNPPASGAYAGNASAVEVIVDQPQTLSMVTLFLPSGVLDVGARAVALMGAAGNYCILALDPTAAGALTLNNSADVTNPKCGVAVDSSSATALVMNNSAVIAGPVTVHGGWSLANSAEMTGSPLKEDAPTVADPYANVQLQTIPACTAQSGTVNNSATANLTPGHFCNGWNFGNSSTVNLAAGAYYVDQQLSVNNSTTLNGTGGVTIIINGNYAISINNSSTINITAPSSGPYAGLAFFGSRTGTSTVQQTFNNSVVMNIQGAVYFPNQIINFNNSASTEEGGCAEVIGRVVNINNSVTLDNNCSGTGVKPIGASPSQLVE